MPSRPGWSNIVRQKHVAAEAALVRSLPSYDIPIADSPNTAPGWRMLAESIYCYKDVMRPWDPAVLLAIREIEPTAMPITIRSTWQHMDRGNVKPPMTLVRHGIARCVRDALIPTHKFRCELPIHPELDLFSSFPAIHSQVAPNYVEINHYDRSVRPYGYDLPGAYLPFDWGFNHMLHRDYENRGRRWQDIAAEFLDPQRDEKRKQQLEDAEYDKWVEKELAKHWNEPASDLEWKEALLGGTKQPEVPAMVTVGSTPEPAESVSIGVGVV